LVIFAGQMIPKNIFQSWYTHSLPTVAQEKIDRMKAMNPGYTYTLFTDEDMDVFVHTYYPGVISQCYDRLNIIVAKVDFWRYLVLYHYGGVYLDMDSSVDAPLDELICHHDRAIVTAEGNPEYYVQWALIFEKGHPILKKTIDLIVDNIQKNRFPNDIHKMTGPTVFAEAIRQTHASFVGVPALVHSAIYQHTDTTMKCFETSMSYRIYGKDYGRFFTFKYPGWEALYERKAHWRQEQRAKPLLL